jgi:7-cyano-7-deazaguanine synthase in queuosine biosynthesis
MQYLSVLSKIAIIINDVCWPGGSSGNLNKIVMHMKQSGRCDRCMLRLKAFEESGYKDL